jgi:hypothetical protein
MEPSYGRDSFRQDDQMSDRQPSATFSDDAKQDPLEGRTLYVLGLSIAGAILANGVLLIYFTSL